MCAGLGDCTLQDPQLLARADKKDFPRCRPTIRALEEPERAREEQVLATHGRVEFSRYDGTQKDLESAKSLLKHNELSEEPPRAL